MDPELPEPLGSIEAARTQDDVSANRNRTGSVAEDPLQAKRRAATDVDDVVLPFAARS
ncbi:MAG: hypothetical protein ACRBN8_35115 [Nannocystales bacterium]